MKGFGRGIPSIEAAIALANQYVNDPSLDKTTQDELFRLQNSLTKTLQGLTEHLAIVNAYKIKTVIPNGMSFDEAYALSNANLTNYFHKLNETFDLVIAKIYSLVAPDRVKDKCSKISELVKPAKRNSRQSADKTSDSSAFFPAVNQEKEIIRTACLLILDNIDFFSASLKEETLQDWLNWSNNKENLIQNLSDGLHNHLKWADVYSRYKDSILACVQTEESSNKIVDFFKHPTGFKLARFLYKEQNNIQIIADEWRKDTEEEIEIEQTIRKRSLSL